MNEKYILKSKREKNDHKNMNMKNKSVIVTELEKGTSPRGHRGPKPECYRSHLKFCTLTTDRSQRYTNYAMTWPGRRAELGPLGVPFACRVYKPNSRRNLWTLHKQYKVLNYIHHMPVLSTGQCSTPFIHRH